MITPSTVKALLVSIDFPPATRITPLPVYAEYHSLWVLTYPRDILLRIRETRLALLPEKPRPLSDNTVDTELILRIADNKLPALKNLNEVANTRWVTSNTRVLAPEIMAHDSTVNNALDREYILETRLRGVNAAQLLPSLTPQQSDLILQQLVDVIIQLYSKPHHHLGALKKNLQTKAILPGPPVNERYYWQLHHITKYWKDYSETYDSLNPCAPNGYPDVSAWITAHIEKSIHRIRTHSALAWMRSFIPRLQALLTWTNTPVVATRLNNVQLRLMNLDPSFSQILVDPKTCRMNGILDWEWSVVLPWPAFKKNMIPSKEDPTGAVRRRFEEIARGKPGGREMVEALEWKYPEQGIVFEVVEGLMDVERMSIMGTGKGREKEVMRQVLMSLDALGV